jgi:hypothetical protein
MIQNPYSYVKAGNFSWGYTENEDYFNLGPIVEACAYDGVGVKNKSCTCVPVNLNPQ